MLNRGMVSGNREGLIQLVKRWGARTIVLLAYFGLAREGKLSFSGRVC
jgi:hypothetical protein